MKERTNKQMSLIQDLERKVRNKRASRMDKKVTTVNEKVTQKKNKAKN